MTNCENHEINLSALIDGEIESIDIKETLDHIVECESCRKFYQDARKLNRMINPLPVLSNQKDKEELPESIWDNIESASRKKEAKVFKMSVPVQTWAVAATVVLAVGLWFGGFFHQFHLLGTEQNPDKVVQVKLEENSGQMTEDRFIELTAELLRSDSRYHRKMLNIMETVNRHQLVLETSNDEGQVELSDDLPDEDNDFSSSRNNYRSSRPVDISFW